MSWCPVLTLPVPPSANRYWRHFGTRVVKSKEAKLYIEGVWQLGTRHRKYRVEGGEVAVRVVWHRKRRSGDLDNRIKVFLDALAGIAYANDSQIAYQESERIDDGLGVMEVSWMALPAVRTTSKLLSLLPLESLTP